MGSNVFAYQIGDRVISTIQSQHVEARSSWNELPMSLFPRFGVDETVIIHAKVPENAVNTTEHKINPMFDFKVTLAFDYNRHSVPWVAVFDKEQRRSMKKLIVTFIRDEFEIVKVRYIPICKTFLLWFVSFSDFLLSVDGGRIAHLDSSHPTLRGFELEYKWENAQEEDFRAGLISMFLSCMVGLVAIIGWVFLWSDSTISSQQNVQSSTGSGKSGKTKR